MSIPSILAIGFGGAVGAVFRVLAIGVVNRLFSTHALPFGTLFVNVIGGFLIGFILSLPSPINPLLRSFLVAGVLGGFTTFSTFSFENMLLLQGANFGLASLNIALSVFLSLIFCYLGMFCAKILV